MYSINTCFYYVYGYLLLLLPPYGHVEIKQHLIIMLLFLRFTECRAVMMYRESRNGRVRSAGVTMRSGRKWTAAKTGGSCAEIKGHLWESMHKETRAWAYSFPVMGQNRWNAKEEHDPSWGPTLGWGGTQGKGGRTRISRSLDQMGLVEVEGNFDRVVQNKSILHLFLAPVNEWYSPNSIESAQVGIEGGPTVQVMWKKRNNGTHPGRIQDWA